MLSITRNPTHRPGDTFYIGHNKEIKIVIDAVKGNQVKINIEAPKEIPIQRDDMIKRKDGSRRDG